MSGEQRRRRVESVQSRHEQALMRLPNVVGVGIGERAGVPVLKVYVARKVPPGQLSSHEAVPSQIEGVAVEVEEVGRFQATEQGDRDDHQ